MNQAGSLTWISGPVVRARITSPLEVLEQVHVGEARLAGEVIALHHDLATIQVYEETNGLHPGEPLYGTGSPLSVMLGPGLLANTYDGLQRPLAVLRDQRGIYLQRGSQADPLPVRKWQFTPASKAGVPVRPGTLLGVIPETPLIEHRVLVPSGIDGKLLEIAPEGDYAPDYTLAMVEDAAGAKHPLTMLERWPIRSERPVEARLEPMRPLITGQRVLDTFAPLAKGGTAAMPGPFGAGKTILQHALAKWCDADVIIYVGCGERGNEMAEVLDEFPRLIDPASGRPLMERTVLIANTSNMPVAAREASIYLATTIAEYYRDQGYDVALMADSTSRWAEALREIAGRLEEMPAEEGFPAYLPSRIAAFYERAGRVRTLGGREGSVSIVGAISPPGGDFTEPVTQHTQRYTRTFWALDRALANARHYPAINWQTSYSLYSDAVAPWWAKETGPEWQTLRSAAAQILEQAGRLEQLVRLVGAQALPDRQRWVLEAARLLKEGFLQQNALHPIDAYCVPAKQLALMRLFVELHQAGQHVIESGVPLSRVRQLLDVRRLVQIKETAPNDQVNQITELLDHLKTSLDALIPQEREKLMRDYLGADRIEGPLVVVEGYGKAAYGELVEVHAPDGVRLGQVLTAGEDQVIAELWSETSGLEPHEVLLRFRGETFQTAVSREMLGRVFDGLGRPRDGLPPPLAEARVDMHGSPLNPAARAYPQHFIETGISAIDGMNTVVRGQKLPIFSGAGLPHNELAAQIALQARISEEAEKFAVVFVALGVSHDTAAYFQQRFEESGLLARTAVFLNLADESPLERMVTPRVALCLAEFLAFEHGYHVLVLLTDITNYAEALREISSRRNEVPGRKAYPGYLYSDLAEIFERCGRVLGRPGSVTQIPILTMPGDDITHPVPDLSGYITEGQIVLSRALHREGIYPPIDILPSLSRLMKNGIGEHRTRADHPSWAAQLYASYARVQEIRAISVVIGETALTSVDRAYLEFGKHFELRLVAQSASQARSITETLDLGWEILSLLPASELTRIHETDLQRHYSGKLEGRAEP